MYYERLKALLLKHSLKRGRFILASGQESSYYIDCRKTTLTGEGALCIGKLLTPELLALNIDAVGGMTIGADPIVAACISRSADMGSPFNGFLVRKEAKSHGTRQAVEGHCEPWMRVALVEDVVTTGGSTLKAIEILKAQYPSITIAGVFAIVDREAGGAETFSRLGIPFRALYSVSALLQE
jgi:orotate phosphoribosyltransferase